MRLIIKSLAGEIAEDQKKYIRKKFLWIEDHVPSNAILTVGINLHINKRSNQACEAIVHLEIPNVKKPIYTRVSKNTFAEAVDISKDKIERIVVKTKDKKSLKFKIKFPRPKIRFFKSKDKK